MSFSMREIRRIIALLAVLQDLQNPVGVEFPSGQYRHQQQMDLRHGQTGRFFLTAAADGPRRNGPGYTGSYDDATLAHCALHHRPCPDVAGALPT